MKTSPAGLALIEQFEGLRLDAYQDGAGIWTIGYGHTGMGMSRAQLSTVQKGETCTEEQAKAWMAEDVANAERAVTTLVKVSLSQNQFDALVSFVYNLGWAAFESSTLLELINSGRIASAVAQFSRWDMLRGEPSPGLLRRRDAEAELFSQATVA